MLWFIHKQKVLEDLQKDNIECYEKTKELLNRTMQCSTCKGTGLIEDKKSTAAQKPCDVCGGTGIVMDNFYN